MLTFKSNAKKLPIFISSTLLLALFLTWTAAWIQKSPNYKWHSRIADVKVGTAILTKNKFIASRENVGYGYAFFILFAQKLFGSEVSSPQEYDNLYPAAKNEWKRATIILLYLAYLCGFILTWLAILYKRDVKSANVVVAVIILFLLAHRSISISLLSEPLYFALVLIIFSLIVLGFNSQKIVIFFLLGLVVLYAGEVRPFPMYGIALPLSGYLMWKYWREKKKQRLKQFGTFIFGLLICKLLMLMIIGYAFDFDPPERSNAYNITLRLLHMDGICWRSNGPACRKLMDIDKKIAPERHKEGWIDENKGTYRYVIKNDGIMEMERLYFQAAKECITTYPYVTLRNTVLNVISFFSHEHLLYLESRRKTSLPYWPTDPEEWKKPFNILLTSAVNNLKYPFWIILLIVLGSNRMRSDIDPSLVILLAFCAVHVLIPSLVGRYLVRFSLPMFVAFFVPLGASLKGRYFYCMYFLGIVSFVTIFIKLLPAVKRVLL